MSSLKDLIDLPLYVRAIGSLHKKKKGQSQDESKLKVVLSNDLTGAQHLGQFFPHPEKFTKFGELTWDGDDQVGFDMGRIPLGYEMVGARVEFSYPPLWKEDVLKYELVDVKCVYLTPKEGRGCKVSLIAIIEPGDGDVEKLYDVLGREVIFTARQAPSDAARAEAQGQRSMALPPSSDEQKDPEDPPAPTQEEAEKQVAAALGTNGVNNTAPEDAPLVPGQKPPQRPKRVGLPAH